MGKKKLSRVKKNRYSRKKKAKKKVKKTRSYQKKYRKISKKKNKRFQKGGMMKTEINPQEILDILRTGKVYDTKADFDADVADPNTDTTVDDFRQDLEITVTRAGNIGAKTKE